MYEMRPARMYDEHMDRWRAELGDVRFLGIGIDRADYTKGIPDRHDRLLETCPEYRGKRTFLQVAVPSRTRIAGYDLLNQEIVRIADQINARWSTETWQPIRLWRRHLPQPELMALHRLASFCMVTSLHDGMNLVAKEFVASRADEEGVLILSSFTGSARKLTSALLVNPCSADQMADAIRQALTVGRRECKPTHAAFAADGEREQHLFVGCKCDAQPAGARESSCLQLRIRAAHHVIGDVTMLAGLAPSIRLSPAISTVLFRLCSSAHTLRWFATRRRQNGTKNSPMRCLTKR